MDADRLGGRFAGRELQRRRVLAKLSRPDFAALCAKRGKSVSRQHLARLERNEFQPGEALLVVMAEVLSCDISDLLEPAQSAVAS
jgi:transcriptional regulator with XRE-family HTH domain